jgi:hypothetical protein
MIGEPGFIKITSGGLNCPEGEIVMEKVNPDSVLVVDKKDDEAGAEAGHDDEFKAITEFKMPEFVNVIFALTGIADLQYKVSVERERRRDESYQNPYLEIEEVVGSTAFECLIAFVIVVNALFIGWEASIPEGENEDVLGAFEHIFTIFFFVEWCLRVVAFGWSWIFEPENFADTFLVFGTGVFTKWIAEPMGFDVGYFRIITVLRTMRLVRVARAARHQHKEMWILIKGLTTSWKPLMWTVVMANVVMYVFATAATELIGNSSAFEDSEKADELFGNFLRSMFTMTQLITMDSYCDFVIRPMMDIQAWVALFFVFFITVGVFIVMNLITAIIVDTALLIVKSDQDSAAKEESEKKKRELKKLAELFMELDVDGSGELSSQEFFGSLKNAKVQSMLASLEMKECELEEVWEVLDDGDGLLTIKEFTDGIRRMKGGAKAKDIAHVIKMLVHTDKKHHDLKIQAKRYSDTLAALDKDVAEMSKDTEATVELFKEMYHRLDSYLAKCNKERKFKVKEQANLEKMAAGEPVDEFFYESEEEEEEDE